MTHQRADNLLDFANLLVQSELLTEQQVQSLMRQFREVYLKSSSFPDIITTFCTFLVASETLTTWQCEKVRNGQWKGFYIDNYIMLDTLGSDSKFGYYLARDTTTNSIARLAITPAARWKNPTEAEYQVQSF